MNPKIIETNPLQLPPSQLQWKDGLPLQLLKDLVNFFTEQSGQGGEHFVLTPDAEQKFHQLTEVFGFDRLPATYSEAIGLLNYCQTLEAALTLGTFSQMDLTGWHSSFLDVLARSQPEAIPALELAYKKDWEGLRELHLAQDTLTNLGKMYSLT